MECYCCHNYNNYIYELNVINSQYFVLYKKCKKLVRCWSRYFSGYWQKFWGIKKRKKSFFIDFEKDTELGLRNSLLTMKFLPFSFALVSSRTGFTFYRGGMAKAPVLFYISSLHSWQQEKGRLSLFQGEGISPGQENVAEERVPIFAVATCWAPVNLLFYIFCY